MAPPPYFALKRAILIVVCLILFSICINSGLFNFENHIAQYLQEDGDYLIKGSRMSKDEVIILNYVAVLFGTLLASCGLFGALYHNLTLMYIFTIFQVARTLADIDSAFRENELDLWVLCFVCSIPLLAISFLIDLHKMKRI